MSGEQLHCPSLVFCILILLIIIIIIITIIIFFLYCPIKQALPQPMSFLSFTLPQLSASEGAAVWGWVTRGVKPRHHVGNKNHHFKIICEMLLRSFILPKENAKVEGWAWSNHPFQYKKNVKNYWSSFLITLGHIYDVLCTWQLHSILCNLIHLFLHMPWVQLCWWKYLWLTCCNQGKQKGKQSPVSFSLFAYSPLPPHPQLLPKELHFCTSGPLILIYATA